MDLKCLRDSAVLAVLAACLSPTSVSDISVWWPEADQRLRAWLYSHPECPQNYVVPLVSVLNEIPTLDGAACEYDASGRLIRAPGPHFTETRYGFGCIPHELGHAALHQAGNQCWRRYEH